MLGTRKMVFSRIKREETQRQGHFISLGRSLPYEVQNHVRSNFATPILYAKNTELAIHALGGIKVHLLLQ
jgi:hypothetical protein